MSLQDLDSQHRNTLDDAISHIIGTQAALETYAQIIDGLPLAHITRNRYKSKHHNEHPIHAHIELRDGAEDIAISMRETFDLTQLSFDSKVLRKPNYSILSRIPLRGLAASMFSFLGFWHSHSIKLVSIFSRKGIRYMTNITPPESVNSIRSVTLWEPTPNPYYRFEVQPTMFAHPFFVAYGLYPYGIADMVGYWAEDRILGGVLLLDRSKEETGDDAVELPNVYFQSSRPARTHFIYQLTDQQQTDLLDFLLSPTRDKDTPSCPLPLSYYHKDNHVTVNPEFAIVESKVYRDPWERPPPSLTRGGRGTRDVQEWTSEAEEVWKRWR
ncbi:hypothetical protein PG996_007577 [Apiospora saccharicola]|uniref:Uncharacterized protein n=1 Tax=Apiospora saccharicola TaxID=335842 RepID=A0ABR1VE01_9PEZI